MTVGERLKQARLEKGLSLLEIQEQTKLPIQNLEAIEHDDYDSLGSPYNIKTIIRAYSLVVGLDADSVVRQYETGSNYEEDYSENEPIQQTRSVPKDKDKPFLKFIPGIILSLVFLLIVGSVGYAFVKEYNRYNANTDIRDTYQVENHADEEKAKEEVVSSVQAPVPEPSVSSSDSEPEMQLETVSQSASSIVLKATNVKGSPELKLKGATGRCWVNVKANGQSLYQGIVEMGAEQKVTVPDKTKLVVISTGNAPVLNIQLNDKQVEINKNGSKQITFTINLEYLN